MIELVNMTPGGGAGPYLRLDEQGRAVCLDESIRPAVELLLGMTEDERRALLALLATATGELARLRELEQRLCEVLGHAPAVPRHFDWTYFDHWAAAIRAEEREACCRAVCPACNDPARPAYFAPALRLYIHGGAAPEMCRAHGARARGGPPETQPRAVR